VPQRPVNKRSVYRALGSCKDGRASDRHGSSAPSGTSEQSNVMLSVLVQCTGQDQNPPDDGAPASWHAPSSSLLAGQGCNRISNVSSGYGSAGSMAGIPARPSPVSSMQYSYATCVISK